MPPQRTAEQIAEKQTERLVRELGITDSVQRDTLYRMHLKYVRLREKSNTRAEELERTQQRYDELKQILTKEQYEQFINKQVNNGPHGPQMPLNRMGPLGGDPTRGAHSEGGSQGSHGKRTPGVEPNRPAQP